MKTRLGSLLPAFAAILATLMVLSGGCSKTPDNAAATSAMSAANVNISDADVSTKVKTALQGSDSLKGFDIAVITTKGDVRLIGVVDNRAQIDEAIRLARAAEGAHAIHDELTLRK